jgi:hypothetical protein
VIAHIVVLTWHPGVTPEQVAEVNAVLGRLPAEIPELLSYSFGANLRLREPGGDYAVCAVVEPEHLARYLDHPAHRDVVERVLGPLVAKRAAAQLTLEPQLASGLVKSWPGTGS